MKQKEPLEIELAPEDEWEVEQGSEEEQESETPDLSDKAISYLAQIQDLQEQLQQEQLKVERLQMAIRGFTIALQEEIKGL
jgi:hypothetical protein|tara:strand:- start:14 stop:256 length:243 start_codon:yes stop_codon:yes gene_type:complete